MMTRYFDVVIAKEFETNHSGQIQKRTRWQRVGRAWTSRSAESLNLELFLLPNHRYVIRAQDREPPKDQGTTLEEAPF